MHVSCRSFGSLGAVCVRGGDVATGLLASCSAACGTSTRSARVEARVDVRRLEARDALLEAQPLGHLLRLELGLDVVVALQQPLKVQLPRLALLLRAALYPLPQRAELLVLLVKELGLQVAQVLLAKRMQLLQLLRRAA